MNDITTIAITALGALGGFLVARATAAKMSAEGAAISSKAFTELARQVQDVMRDNAELHRQIAELRSALVAKEARIAELEHEVRELRGDFR